MNLNLAPISNLNFRANSMGFLGKIPRKLADLYQEMGIKK